MFNAMFSTLEESGTEKIQGFYVQCNFFFFFWLKVKRKSYERSARRSALWDMKFCRTRNNLAFIYKTMASKHAFPQGLGVQFS